MRILIDNGHGENTKGKRSPDGAFREYAYARELANDIVRELAKRGYEAERIVKENSDVPLQERARRVNEVCGRWVRRMSCWCRYTAMLLVTVVSG